MKNFSQFTSICFFLLTLVYSSINLYAEENFTRIPEAERRYITGTVILPKGSKYKFEDLHVERLGVSKAKVNNDGSFRIIVNIRENYVLSIYTPEIEGQESEIFLETDVMKGFNTVELSPKSTAINAMNNWTGNNVIVHPNDYPKVLEIYNSTLNDLTVFLDKKLGENPHFLKDQFFYDFKDKEFETIFNTAKVESIKGVKDALENDEVRPNFNLDDRPRNRKLKRKDSKEPLLAEDDKSNTTWLHLSHQQLVKGKIVLPKSSILVLSDLKVFAQYISGFAKYTSEANVDKDGNFKIITIRSRPSRIQVFSPNDGILPTITLFSAMILPGESEIELNSLTTAANLLYQDLLYYKDDLLENYSSDVKHFITQSVPSFVTYLNTQIIENQFSERNFTNPEYLAEYKKALISAKTALDTAIENGDFTITSFGTKRDKEFFKITPKKVSPLITRLDKTDRIKLENTANNFLEAYMNADSNKMKPYFSNKVNFLGDYSLFNESKKQSILSEKTNIEMTEGYENFFTALNKKKPNLWKKAISKVEPHFQTLHVENDYHKLQELGLFETDDFIYDLHFREANKGERNGFDEAIIFVFRKVGDEFLIIAHMSDL